MSDLITKIDHMLNESETERMVRWAKTFSENHGLYPDEKGFFDVCVTHMSDSLGEENAKGYCARVKDVWSGSTHWRGKDKSKEDVKSDTEDNKNYPKSKKAKKEREKTLKED
jgi:hypothetical protein